MELTRTVAEEDEGLQELFDHPPRITQTDLAEYLRLESAYLLARTDLEAVASQLTEMLILGSPVEPGQHRARIASGKLVVEIPAIEY